MNQLGTTLLAFSVTVAGVAVVAQPQDPPPTSSASRKQSGTVGPPIDAASAQAGDTNAASATPPAVQASGDDADADGASRPRAYTRKASGRVTPAGEPSAGPAIRADRN
ncbi:hypothetical protein CDN99_01015 [Roseateles aquatilis]|uniref:Uncharacterized protein n=1 Tax=Roseateles aquatilis TaxID=431061 RepID=A0A246JKK0_9BURK|nr:hypothetical protein [Roseateles aquatilis]OWQ93115.1 hypothetical protein CDN99_01015 [Roseateles aquatilis]